MAEAAPQIQYPRLIVSAQTHRRVKKIAQKRKTSMAKIGDRIARAGLKALGW